MSVMRLMADLTALTCTVTDIWVKIRLVFSHLVAIREGGLVIKATTTLLERIQHQEEEAGRAELEQEIERRVGDMSSLLQ